MRLGRVWGRAGRMWDVGAAAAGGGDCRLGPGAVRLRWFVCLGLNSSTACSFSDGEARRRARFRDCIGLGDTLGALWWRNGDSYGLSGLSGAGERCGCRGLGRAAEDDRRKRYRGVAWGWSSSCSHDRGDGRVDNDFGAVGLGDVGRGQVGRVDL